MLQNAQATVEFFVVTVVSLSLLLLGVMLYAQYNALSNEIIALNENVIECNKIAGLISQVYASNDTAQKNIAVSKTIQIQRTGTNPGQITAGTYYCNYFGNTAKKGAPDIPDNGIGGFSLDAATYKAYKSGSTVFFEIVS